MDALLGSLKKLNGILASQMAIFCELVPVLDDEETQIGRFSLQDFEEIIVRKDQLVQRASRAERRRLDEMKKICFLMGYDARLQMPSVTEFEVIFSAYMNNVKGLLDEQMYASLEDLRAVFFQRAREFRVVFAQVAPRLYRNRKILEKLAVNFHKSVALLESEGVGIRQYGANGRAGSWNGHESVSFVRVRV